MATYNVSTIQQLQTAINTINTGAGGDTVILADGTYDLTGIGGSFLHYIQITKPNVTVRSASGNRSAVILKGDGMKIYNGGIGFIFSVEAAGFTLQGVTCQEVGYHCVIVKGENGADDVTLRNCVFKDSFEMLVKGTADYANLSNYTDRGLIENCHFEYTTGIGPNSYIGGIDIHRGHDWVVRNNTFSGIASPSTATPGYPGTPYNAEHAIHFWRDGANITIENNVIINCDRGIGLGLGTGSANNVKGGRIVNNMIYHANLANHVFADVGIGIEDSPNVDIYHNTVFFDNDYPNAIEYRFAGTVGSNIKNNLTNKAVRLRDGAIATVSNNFTAATSNMFVNSSIGDLHLAIAVPNVVNSAVAITGAGAVTTDIDGITRPQGVASDIGADEYSSTVPDVDIAGTGLKINPMTGKISGIPTTAGTLRLNVTATNSFGDDINEVSITINAAVVNTPVLITAPSIETFFPATATSAQVLGAIPGKYQYDDGVRFSGTTSAGDLRSSDQPNGTCVFYIGSVSGLSNTNDEYKNWYLFAEGVLPYNTGNPPGYNGILSYDATTKCVTVGWSHNSGDPAPSPTIGGKWYLVKEYPITRKGQWKRNGVAIPGAKTRAYTVTSSDIGQQITYEETVGFVDWTFVQKADASVVPPLPSTPYATNTSNPYVPTSVFSKSTAVTAQSDFTYLGSFKTGIGYSDSKVSVVPASASANGQISLLLSGRDGANSYFEISIPTLRTDLNINTLNTSTINRQVVDIFDGWIGRAKTGFAGFEGIVGGVCALGTDSIGSSVGYYTSQNSNYFIKRPSDITQQPSLNPFCVYPTNQTSSYGRWAGGSICEIPSALRPQFGGSDLLSSSGVLAIAASNSQRPAGMAYKSSDIDGAIAKYRTGTVVSGTNTTAILEPTASSVNDFYKDWQVVFGIDIVIDVDGVPTAVPNSTGGHTAYVTAYNGATKQITFNSFGRSVLNGSTYSLIAPVYAKQLYGGDAYEPDSKLYPIVWNTGGGSFNFCAFIPRGTTSVVNITNVLMGRAQYGLWATYPDNQGNYWGGMDVNATGRIITATKLPEVSPGPVNGSVWRDDENNYCLFWSYDTDDLAQVYAGTKTYDQVNPQAVFSFELPFGGTSGSISAAFDNDNNRLYIYQKMSLVTGAQSALVHVYSCDKWL